ncbi:MAG: MoaD/ThiS family protein [Candidatus Brockarchaeota archaeon]|nr:MoaD/ThiS family protein [Candidatus Brockarchaeota archaeon]
MKIKVRYFASFRELVECEEETFDLDEDRSISGLISKITSRHPKLKDERIMIAVNEVLIDPTNRLELNQNDVVAVFPMASGG